MSAKNKPTRTVAVLFGSGSSIKPLYDEAYRTLYAMAEKRHIRMVRVSTDWYDEQKKVFKSYVGLEDGKWIQHDEHLRPDLVYDKSSSLERFQKIKRGIEEMYPFLNATDFTRQADDKLQASLLLPRYFQPYLLIENQAQWEEASREPSDCIVAKKAIGSGGDEVYIGPRSKFEPKRFTYPFLLQKFIDSSRGIPGIVHGPHDLRMIFIDEEFIYAYVRTPKAGEFRANVAKGGSMFLVEKERLPQALAPLIENVQRVFRRFSPKIYTIDCMFDRTGRPWIIELNTMPGLYFAPHERSAMLHFYSRIIDTFERMLA